MTGLMEAVGPAISAAGPAIGGVAQIAQAGATVVAAQTQAAGMRRQAQQQDTAARQEQLRGEAQALQVRDALRRTLASQNARYAAAGLSLDSGTPETLAEATGAEADRQIRVIGANAEQRANARLAAADDLRASADMAGAAGWGQAGMGLLDYADRSYRRTPGTVKKP